MTGASSSIDRPQVRRFGAIAFPLFGLLFGVKCLLASQVRPHLFGVMAIFGGLCFLLPGPMTPLYRAWMFVGRTVMRGLSLVMLILSFYLFLTPYSLLMRLVRGRSLPWGPDKNLDTYWVTRTVPAQSKDQFFKRY